VKDISEVKLSIRGVILIALCTAVYIGCLYFLPQKMRLLLVIGAALIIAFMAKPRPIFWLSLLPLIFISGGTTLKIGEFNPAIATLVMIMFTFFYIADRIIRNEPLFVPSPFLFFFIVSVLIQISSVFISIHVHDQYTFNAIREGSSIFLFFPMAVIIPVLCINEKVFNRILRAIVSALFFASLIGVLQYFSIADFSRADIGIGYLYRGRISSLFGNPNIFACYLEIAIPLGIAQIFREKSKKWKIFSLTAVALGLLSVLYTFSRGGLVFTFIGGVVILIYAFRSKLWIPVLIIVGILSLLIMNAETFDRQISFFTNPEAQAIQPTILHRYVAYQGFLNQFSESPITGCGWGAREFYWGRSIIYSFWEVRHCISTQTISRFGGLNSLILNHAVKGGIISVISVILIFAVIIAAFIKALKMGGGIIAVAIIAGNLCFFGHQIIDNTLRFPTVNSLFWIVTGLLLALTSSGLVKSDTDTGKNLNSNRLYDI